MNERELKNDGSKFDELDMEHGDVAVLLSSLSRVEAPKNFEFGVKARIAKGAPRLAGFIPFLKVAAPSTLLLVVAVLVTFYLWVPAPNETAAITDFSPKETTQTLPTPVLIHPAPAPKLEPQTVNPMDGQLGIAKARRIDAPPVRKTRRPAGVSTDGRGSFDTGIKRAPVITAPGFESTNPNNGNSNSNNVRPVQEVFEMLGISADPVETGWKVRGLMVNSLASRAKVQLGDIVESIDGQQLKGNSIPIDGVTVLTVRRDGKSINLNLK